MSLPRGFKAQADRIAIGLRRQMHIADAAPVDLDDLANRLGLSIVPISRFSDSIPASITQLVDHDRGALSALLLRSGRRRLILVNDGHSWPRRNSSIAHEIAHVLLAHTPTQLFDSAGCRNLDQGVEDEASCLSGHILVPNEAAMEIVCSGLHLDTACNRYGVSLRMLDYRLNASGARIRHRRWSQKQANLAKMRCGTVAARFKAAGRSPR